MARGKQEEQRGSQLAGREKSNPPSGRSWFLGIGINDYQHFPPLHNAVRDVQAIQSLLQERYELDEAELLLNEQANRRAILRKLEELARKVQPEDKLLILFSGHGYLSPGGLGFWVPVEAESGYSEDYIPNSRLRDFLQEIRSRHTLLVSDACFSGALFVKGQTRRSTEAEEILEGKISRYGFCSGRSNEEVYDGPPGEHSPFAGSLLSVLRENKMPRLRVSLLAEEVMSRTAAQYRQLPHHGPLFDVGDQGGQYVFRLRSSEENVWQDALQENSIRAYNRYLDQFPHGRHADQALEKIQLLEDDREWEKAIRIDRIYAYRTYLRSFPTPRQAEAAQQRITELEAEDAPAIPKPKSILQSERPKVVQPAPKEEKKVQPNTFTDPRDGQSYRTVELNGLRWMAQNLNFDVGEGCWVYYNDPKNGEKYGRLYTWEAAKRACPPGWRLATDGEWKKLAMFAGGYADEETSIWKTFFPIAYGNPERGYANLIKGGSTGFSALLGGWRLPDGSWHNLGNLSYYWSASEYNAVNVLAYAVNFNSHKLYRELKTKAAGLYCRCVQD